jgi:type I restriction enzyme, S subunit
MKWMQIGEVAEVITGSTPKKKNPNYFGGNVPWIKPGDVQNCIDPIIDTDDTLSELGSTQARIVPPGAVLVTCIGEIGRVGITGKPSATNQQINAVVFKDTVLPEFGFYSILYSKAHLEKSSTATTVPILNKSNLMKVSIPILTKQKQLELVSKMKRLESAIHFRKNSFNLLDNYLRSLFAEMFGEPATNSKKFPIVRLDQVTEIGSGITKGKKYGTKKLTEVPYIRVANVQAGYLDLKEMKTIEVAQGEIERFLLKPGDVLMTEGGDWDKIGRGAVWDGSISPCIHQNYIFRVRSDIKKILPFFLDSLLQTNYAKSFFQRAAKQTTNLATINKTQLSAFLVPLPPIEQQQKFCEIRSSVAKLVCQMEKSATDLDALMQSVLSESFSEAR